MRLSLRGNVLLMTPWCPALSKSLSYRRRIRVQEPGRPMRHRYVPTNLFDVQEGVGLTHAGMLPRVIRELTIRGMPYEIEDLRQALPEPEYSRLQPLREMQDQVLAAIVSSHGGIIKAPTAFGKSFIICQLCRIYPQLRILIVSRSQQVVGQLFKRICAAAEDRKVSVCDGAHTFKPESEVVICTARSMHKIPAEWPHLLLFDEVHGAGSEDAVVELARFSSTRRFGFSASPQGRSDNADRHVEALFGKQIVDIPYAMAEDLDLVAGIDVNFVDVDCEIDEKRNEVAKKRWGYWRNQYRNRLIAQATEDFDPTWQRLILVETVEHALALRQLLPEYAVVHAGISEEDWTRFVNWGLVLPEQRLKLKSVDTAELRNQFQNGALLRAIVTPTWKEGVDFTYLRILTRADGAPGQIPSVQIPGRLSRTGVKDDGILIDFYDNFGGWYLNRSQERERVYRKHGWKVTRWVPGKISR